jgi:hypothetical protein
VKDLAQEQPKKLKELLDLPPSSLKPAMVHDLDLMHPEKLANSGVRWELARGQLVVTF